MAIYGYRGASATRSAASSSTIPLHAAARRAWRSATATCSTWAACACVSSTPPVTRAGTRCFHVEPDDVLYLGDIDLSSFGPYYGDAWSSLEDFERTLALVRDIDARWYATFHHIGVLDGREAFLERLDRFAAVIGDREGRLLAYLAEPRTLDEMAAHRFVYRPGDAVPFAEPVERRSMAQHVERLRRDGRVREVDARPLARRLKRSQPAAWWSATAAWLHSSSTSD